MSLLSAAPRSAWIVIASFSGSPASPVGLYTITRADGGPCSITCRALIANGSNDVFVMLSEPMLEGVGYVLAVSPDSVAFGFSKGAALAPVTTDTGDPEVEFFGQDYDWLFGDVTGSGDCEVIRGEECLRRDSVCLGLLDKGELAQFPDRGAGMLRRVNSTSSPEEMQATLVSEWRQDDRVADAGAEVVENTGGDVDFNGRIQSKAVSSRQISVSSGD